MKPPSNTLAHQNHPQQTNASSHHKNVPLHPTKRRSGQSRQAQSPQAKAPIKDSGARPAIRKLAREVRADHFKGPPHGQVPRDVVLACLLDYQREDAKVERKAAGREGAKKQKEEVGESRQSEKGQERQKWLALGRESGKD